MDENCRNCRHRLEITKLDYSQGGCKHTDMEGFVCTGLAYEGTAYWMVGLEPEKEMCEMWEGKVKEDAPS